MIKQYYSCRLNDEVVLNSRIATEGNMTTLDYIPGSNFLGVVARHYHTDKLMAREYDVFHAGKVQFGDGLPTTNEKVITWRMPCSLMTPKIDKKRSAYLQHLIPELRDDERKKLDVLQLKQERGKYIDEDGQEVSSVKKIFRLKSAHDADIRRSKDEQMFGFESISRGQTFIFSVDYDNEELKKIVEPLLLGDQRIGKSRTAEYGSVTITKIEPGFKEIRTFEFPDHYLVYLESHLCYFDSHGMPSFEPEPGVFGISGGRIDWKRSQVRNISWAPWNAKRNTTDTQRHAIAAGSVFCIVPVQGQMTISNKIGSIGGFQAEGLGRFIINPFFLKGDKESARATAIKLLEKNENDHSAEQEKKSFELPIAHTKLGHLLLNRLMGDKQEQSLMDAVSEALRRPETKLLLDSNVTSSQWGTIRNIAEARKTYDEVSLALFGKSDSDWFAEDNSAYLRHGVSFQSIWGRDNALLLRKFKEILDMYASHGPAFTGRFCSEISKKSKKP